MPGASKTEIAGWLGPQLKVRVTAPPERGRANSQVIACIAGALNIPITQVTLISGERSEQKTLEIAGLTEAEIDRRLG